jgi:hypothetical protein
VGSVRDGASHISHISALSYTLLLPSLFSKGLRGFLHTAQPWEMRSGKKKRGQHCTALYRAAKSALYISMILSHCTGLGLSQQEPVHGSSSQPDGLCDLPVGLTGLLEPEYLGCFRLVNA